jgi:hypothetical protein
MSGIFWNMVSPAMRQIMAQFAQSEVGIRFYLAGGTALALQLGHRQSFDLDYFSLTEDIPLIRSPLAQALSEFAPVLADASWGNLVFLAQGVRVGFYGYGYRLLEPFVDASGVQLASILDIGLMKLDALLGRASRKDFHDIYQICQSLPLRSLLSAAPRKYPNTRDFEAQVVRRLIFFDHAEQEAPLPSLNDVPWETVKQYFSEQALMLGKDWIA